jgi:type II secretory pathway predicted ATPase ExeA
MDVILPPTDLQSDRLHASGPSGNRLRLFYPSLGHTDCIERLEDATRAGGLILVTGDDGLGKSLLMDVLVEEMTGTFTTVAIPHPQQVRTDIQLLRSLLERVDAHATGRTGLQLGSELQRVAIRFYRQEKPLRIVIDDAHLLTSSQLEIFRGLLSFAAPASGMVGTILFARPEIIEKIDRKRGLAAQVEMRHALNPFNRKDTAGLVRHRLRELSEPGSAPVHFSEEALDIVHARAKGIPAVVMSLVNACLASAASLRRASVDAAMALAALAPAQQKQARLPFDMLPRLGPNGGSLSAVAFVPNDLDDMKGGD